MNTEDKKRYCKKSMVAIAVLFFLFILSCMITTVHAQTSCSTSAECVDQTFGENIAWFGISMGAVMIALTVSGILFSVGYALSINQLKQTGRAELMQAVASLVLVLFLFGTLGLEGSLIGTIQTSTGLIAAGLATSSPEKFGITPAEYQQIIAAGGIVSIDPFTVADAFLLRLVDCMQSQYTSAMNNAQFAEIFANMQLKIEIDTGPPPEGTQWALPTDFFKMIGGADSINSQVQRGELLADDVTWTSILIYAQLALMKFIETSMFTIFLPIGIILRAFPPTRGAGAVLVALAIGLYVVFPLTYLLFYIATPNAVEGCNLTIPVSVSAIQPNCPIYPSTTTQTAGAAMADTYAAESNLMVIQNVATQVKYLVWLYLLMAISITFIFVRSAAGILGADISEIGRSMFKMV